MAVQALPTIQTIFSGDGITSNTRNFQFTLGEKIEKRYYNTLEKLNKKSSVVEDEKKTTLDF